LSNSNEVFTPYVKSPKFIKGQNYFKLSDREYKEFFHYDYDINGTTNNHYLSSFEQTDTSLTPSNNYVFDSYLDDKLYHFNKSKDTLIGINTNGIYSFSNLMFSVHFNNEKKYVKVVDLLSGYKLLKYQVLNNKFAFVLEKGNEYFIAIIDNNYDLIILQKLNIDLKVGYKENLTINIDSQSDNIINLTILRHLDFYYHKISIYNNEYKLEASSNSKLMFLENSQSLRIGSLYDNKPYLINLSKQDSLYNLYLFDENNVEKQTKIELPFKIRSKQI